MYIFVVIDVDDFHVVKAFRDESEFSEEIAQDFADDYYYETGHDCRVERTYLRRGI